MHFQHAAALAEIAFGHGRVAGGGRPFALRPRANFLRGRLRIAVLRLDLSAVVARLRRHIERRAHSLLVALLLRAGLIAAVNPCRRARLEALLRAIFLLLRREASARFLRLIRGPAPLRVRMTGRALRVLRGRRGVLRNGCEALARRVHLLPLRLRIARRGGLHRRFFGGFFYGLHLRRFRFFLLRQSRLRRHGFRRGLLGFFGPLDRRGLFRLLRRFFAGLRVARRTTATGRRPVLLCFLRTRLVGGGFARRFVDRFFSARLRFGGTLRRFFHAFFNRLFDGFFGGSLSRLFYVFRRLRGAGGTAASARRVFLWLFGNGQLRRRGGFFRAGNRLFRRNGLFRCGRFFRLAEFFYRFSRFLRRFFLFIFSNCFFCCGFTAAFCGLRRFFSRSGRLIFRWLVCGQKIDLRRLALRGARLAAGLFRLCGRFFLCRRAGCFFRLRGLFRRLRRSVQHSDQLRLFRRQRRGKPFLFRNLPQSSHGHILIQVIGQTESLLDYQWTLQKAQRKAQTSDGLILW